MPPSGGASTRPQWPQPRQRWAARGRTARWEGRGGRGGRKQRNGAQQCRHRLPGPIFFLPALRSSCLVLAHAHGPHHGRVAVVRGNRQTRPRLIPPPAPQLLYRRNGKRTLRWERQEGERGEHAGEDGEPTGGGQPVASPCHLAPGALAPSPPPAPCVVTNLRGWAHRALGGWAGRGGLRRRRYQRGGAEACGLNSYGIHYSSF